MSGDPHEARMELASWFAKMLAELDEDHVDDPAAIDDLRYRAGKTFAEWRLKWGYITPGSGGGQT